ncbi:MAG: class I SAM-dependent methyltransferase [candidate division WOR-3 bacterium]
MSVQLRLNVERLWQVLQGIRPPKQYVNVEGGGIEQQHDWRLRLHHCANYAAALTILRQENRRLRLLELGCGTGALSYGLARIMPPEWSLMATDYSRYLIEYARQQYSAPNLVFDCLDVNDISASALREFDAVLMLELIEHLNCRETRELLHRLGAGLKPASLVVISTPDRSAFPRDHSGYYPHKIEYRYSTLFQFLSGLQNNPFRSFELYQIVAPGIVRAAVRTERRGGYFFNRVAGLIERLSSHQVQFRRYQRRVLSWLSRVFWQLTGGGQRCDITRLLDDLQLTGTDSGDHQLSFSLVAVLRK